MNVYRGVDFQNSGDFSVQKRTVLFINYYPGQNVESRPGLQPGLYASFLKGQGHQGIFSLTKGTL